MLHCTRTNVTPSHSEVNGVSELFGALHHRAWRAKKPLGKLAALREAQLWMLHEGIKRGLVRVDDLEDKKPTKAPPFYWAAFVLSGDWR